MSHGLAISGRKQSVSSFFHSTSTRLAAIAAMALVASVATVAQNPEVQQKFAAAQQAAAQNKARLRQYQWTETTQITLKGERSLRSKICASTDQTDRFRRLPLVPRRHHLVAAG